MSAAYEEPAGLDVETFVDILYGDRDGWVAVARGYDPYFDDGGKYRHRRWAEHRVHWPADRAVLLGQVGEDMTSGSPIDWYASPALRNTDDRRGFQNQRGSNAAPIAWLWGDLDDEVDREFVDYLGAMLIGSGRDGHLHVYVALDRPISVGDHRKLNKALATRLGADAKWSDEAVLRVAGTSNFKPYALEGSAPAPVQLLRAHTRSWSLEAIADVLKVDLGGSGSGKAGAKVREESADEIEPEPAPDPLPPRVRWALRHTEVQDKSRAHHRLVGACKSSGLTLGQTYTICRDYGPTKGKYEGRLAGEVARSWAACDDPEPDGPTGEGEDDTTAGARSGPLAQFLLPDAVWDHSPLMARIYGAAMARLVCPDALLHTVVTIVASLLNYKSRVVTGKGPSMLSAYFAPVADSGGGKDEALKAGRELLRGFIEGTERFAITGADGWVDDHLGSGEGLLDCFLGEVHHPMVDPSTGEPILDKDGNQRTEKVRAQIRHNALMSDGEGRRVLALDARKGSTLLPRLCDMWTGASVGERNTEAGGRSRRLKAETCQVGIILGFQLDTVDALFDDTAGGTPQRFVFAPAQYAPFAEDLDADVLDEHPGELALDVSVAPITVTLAPDQRRLVRRAIRAKAGGVSIPEAPNGPLDGHRMLIQCRIAALLEIMHGNGETELVVSEETWNLAELLTRHSCALRDWLADRGRQRAAQQRESRKRDQVEVHERASAASEYRQRLQRAADSLVRYLEKNGPTPRGTAKAGITSSVRRTHGDAAIEKLLDEGVISERGSKLELS